jgi:RND superfamily putative drug exporter
MISQSVGSSYKNSFTLNGTQSFEALSLLQKVAPKASGDREQIVVAVTQGRLTDPAVRSQVDAMLAKVAALRDVASVASPYAVTGATQISSSGQIGFANKTLNEQASKVTSSGAKQFVDTAKTGAQNGVQVEVEGQVAEAANAGNVSTVGLGAAAALVVLLLVFGSLLAATLPLVTAGIALGSSVAVIGLVSHLLSMTSFSSELSLLIGLGVGVDYALFIVTRFRQAAARQADRASDHRRHRHGRASGHVRRDHRLHRPPGHVRPRGELPLRRRLSQRASPCSSPFSPR